MLFIILQTFSQIIIYLSKMYSSLIIQCIHLVLSAYLLYTHSWKEYAQRSSLFIIFVTNEIFKTSLYFLLKGLFKSLFFLKNIFYNYNDYSKAFFLIL